VSDPEILKHLAEISADALHAQHQAKNPDREDKWSQPQLPSSRSVTSSKLNVMPTAGHKISSPMPQASPVLLWLASKPAMLSPRRRCRRSQEHSASKSA